MNVIFLDIDGVMNSDQFYNSRYKRRWFKLDTYKYFIISKLKFICNGFKHKATSLADYKINPKHTTYKYRLKDLKYETDKLKWKWLSDFCNKYNYKICISSVWRSTFNINEWCDVLISLGFNEDIFVGVTDSFNSIRGNEIQHWVDVNKVKYYAILDDDSDMLPTQLSTCFFHVDSYYGLSPNHLYRINRYFDKCKKY